MALASYGEPSATGAPSDIADSMQVLFGAQTPRRLGISFDWERGKFDKDGMLLRQYSLRLHSSGRMGRKRGRERKRRKAGRSRAICQTFEGLFHRTIREEGGRCQLSCKFRGVLIPIQR